MRSIPFTSRKIPISFTLEPEQHRRLQLLSERTGVPKSVYVRKAIDRVLREEFEKVQPGLFTTSPPERQPTP